jgi:hypothetical protein
LLAPAQVGVSGNHEVAVAQEQPGGNALVGVALVPDLVCLGLCSWAGICRFRLVLLCILS